MKLLKCTMADYSKYPLYHGKRTFNLFGEEPSAEQMVLPISSTALTIVVQIWD